MDNTKTYGPQQVCDAAGIRRQTFHSWLARKYLPLPPGPGMGRERQFSANEAVLIAIAADLTKLGLSITVAARVVDFLNSGAGGLWPRVQHEDGWLLITGPSTAPVGVDPGALIPTALLKPKTLAAFRRYIRESWEDPAALVIADVSGIARRVLERLR